MISLKPIMPMLIISGALSFAGRASASVTLYAEYHLGEAGSINGSNPYVVDSATANGAQNFPTLNSSGIVVGTAGVAAPGSTAYIDTTSASTGAGYYGADFSSLQTDNFAFGIYARAASLATANQGNIISLGNSGGYISIAFSTNGWAASVYNQAWIGPSGGTGFVANEWVSLAVIRSGGVSTFYVNGVAQAGTATQTPTMGNAHLAVTPGGASTFRGFLDEARVATFTAGESTANILSMIQTGSVVPEPSTYGLLGAGALAGVSFVRRRRKTA